jgi:hypothetical protein
MANNPTSIEKINLEAHVELCAERYASLEQKLNHLDRRLSTLEEHIVEIKDSVANKSGGFNKQLITLGTGIIGAMFAAIITLLIHLASK